MINVNYQRDHVLYQIFKIILSIFKKKHGKNTDNLIRKKGRKYNYVAGIKAGNYIDLSTPETIKIIGSTKNKLTEDKIGESVPH